MPCRRPAPGGSAGHRHDGRALDQAGKVAVDSDEPGSRRGGWVGDAAVAVRVIAVGMDVEAVEGRGRDVRVGPEPGIHERLGWRDGEGNRPHRVAGRVDQAGLEVSVTGRCGRQHDGRERQPAQSNNRRGNACCSHRCVPFLGSAQSTGVRHTTPSTASAGARSRTVKRTWCDPAVNEPSQQDRPQPPGAVGLQDAVDVDGDGEVSAEPAVRISTNTGWSPESYLAVNVLAPAPIATCQPTSRRRLRSPPGRRPGPRPPPPPSLEGGRRQRPAPPHGARLAAHRRFS